MLRRSSRRTLRSARFGTVIVAAVATAACTAPAAQAAPSVSNFRIVGSFKLWLENAPRPGKDWRLGCIVDPPAILLDAHNVGNSRPVVHLSPFATSTYGIPLPLSRDLTITDRQFPIGEDENGLDPGWAIGTAGYQQTFGFFSPRLVARSGKVTLAGWLTYDVLGLPVGYKALPTRTASLKITDHPVGACDQGVSPFVVT